MYRSFLSFQEVLISNKCVKNSHTDQSYFFVATKAVFTNHSLEHSGSFMQSEVELVSNNSKNIYGTTLGTF